MRGRGVVVRGSVYIVALGMSALSNSAFGGGGLCPTNNDVGCCNQDNECVNVDKNTCLDPLKALQGLKAPEPCVCVGGGSGGCCEGVQACCMPGGTCEMMDGACCRENGGTPGGRYSQCGSEVMACCAPDGSCSDQLSVCCVAGGGTPGGSGSTCGAPAEACCSGEGADTACTFVEPVCCAGTPMGPGSDCQGDSDINYQGQPTPDGIPDACDNCPYVPNVYQEDDDEDGVGEHCDNCRVGDCEVIAECFNPDQADEEPDGFGDVCDNCVSCYNFNQTNWDDDDFGDCCDSCPLEPDPNQHDCDGDEVGDVCESGDNDDLDDDGVSNVFDLCDYTPFAQLQDPGGAHLISGALLGDFDGDCDVDEDDRAVFEANFTGPGCADALQVSETCDQPAPTDVPYNGEASVCRSEPSGECP